MLMRNPKLRYKIRDWRDLPKCLSNTSRKFEIKVNEIIQNDDVQGTQIVVEHSDYGVMFACLLYPTGKLFTYDNNPTGVIVDDDFILSQLSQFGYDVEFSPRIELTNNQGTILNTIHDLGFTHIRVVNIRDELGNIESNRPQVVAMIGELCELENPWSRVDYSPTLAELTQKVTEGSVFNLSNLLKNTHYNWSWLHNSVIAISRVLASAILLDSEEEEPEDEKNDEAEDIEEEEYS